MSLKAPRGTQDILPADSPAFARVESRFRAVFGRYGYEEIRTPIFESTELFQRGVGEATDIVQKEMYTFTDRKGRSLTLRPEGTAPVARAFVEHKLYASGRPWKVFYIGPMFRYERPQAGRYRQHQQVGGELLGASTPETDFEVVSLFVDGLAAVGLSGLDVLINSVGDGTCRPEFTAALLTYLDERVEGLCPDCVRRKDQNPLRVLDCKVPGCREIARDIPSIQEHLCSDCRDHQTVVLELLEGAGIPHRIDDRLVRGLDYYTRTVFEVQHGGLGAQSAVGGGGRYDRLVEEVGGPPTAGIGFSSGVERLVLALEAEGAERPGPGSPQVVVAVAGGDAERRAAFLLTRRLRSRFRAEIDLTGKGLGGQLKTAGRSGARAVVIVGDGELSSGTWTVKDMAEGSQESVADTELETLLDRIVTVPRMGKDA